MRKYFLIMISFLIIMTSCSNGSKNDEITPPVGEVKNPPIQQEIPKDIQAKSLKGKDITIYNFSTGQKIKSPLKLTGKMPTNWVNEGVFPVKLLDGSGAIVAKTHGTANIWDENGNPITPSVDFAVEINFGTLNIGSPGKLVISADNASGMPENDDSIKIDIVY